MISLEMPDSENRDRLLMINAGEIAPPVRAGRNSDMSTTHGEDIVGG